LAGLLGLAGLLLPASGARADDWPQWLGPQRDGMWRETGLVKKFPSGGPRVLWRTPIGGGYAGPAVANGRVYVLDRQLAPGSKDPSNPFSTSNSAGKERVLCLDAATGKQIWEHGYDCTYRISYPAGPRATPLVADGKVYTLGAMGHLFCLDAGTGKPIWSKRFTEDYGARNQVWGFAASPLLDGDKLICLVGGKGSVVVAFDKNTGRELWKNLSMETKDPGYCPPMIYTVGKTRQLIIWHPESVNGLDPETGKVHWSHEWDIKANLTIPTPRLSGNRLFLTSFYNGALLLELNEGSAPKVVWQSKGRGERPNQTDALHSIMPTPFLVGEYVYGVCSYGELRCLELATGKRVWSDTKATGPYKQLERWANAFLVPQGDRWFLFNEKGDLIIARLTPKGYEEIDRAHILDPTAPLSGGGPGMPVRKVVWSHPAFANKAVYARNDKEIVAVSLAEEAEK
jgi:outer membrane protein assembly factor BamB